MQNEKVELYFQQGGSDKVYHLELESVGDHWSVQARWGRRGSTLQSDTKVSSSPYEEAKRAYNRILREKTGKGYQIAQTSKNGDTPISVGLPATKEHSGHVPELLTPIEEPEALRLAQDPHGHRESARQLPTSARSTLSKCVTSTAIPDPMENSSKRSISERCAMTWTYSQLNAQSRSIDC